jgi:hypothetical protein
LFNTQAAKLISDFEVVSCGELSGKLIHALSEQLQNWNSSVTSSEGRDLGRSL